MGFERQASWLFSSMVSQFLFLGNSSSELRRKAVCGIVFSEEKGTPFLRRWAISARGSSPMP